MAVTFTQAQIDALAEVVARGVERAKNGDQDVQYGNLKDMMALLDRMSASVTAATEGTAGRSSVSYMRMRPRCRGYWW